jgi:triphosphatase
MSSSNLSENQTLVPSFDEAQQPREIALVPTVISHSREQLQPLDAKYSHRSKPVGLAAGAALNFAPPVVDASMTVAEVAVANLRRYLAEWQLHEPGARLGEDLEELHDLRVAGRRLDAILRQFRPYLPVPILRIRPTLKTVLRALGSARDLDVALIELEAFSRGLPESERDSAEPLKRHLVSESGRARARMLSVLDSLWVQKNLQEFTSLLSAPSAASQPSSPELMLQAAPELIRRRYRKLRKGADLLTPDSSMEAYHQARGRVKRFRYALEAMAVIYGKPADAMLRTLRRWQEKLGVQQDAAVASRRLKALASAPPKGIPPETLFLMGRLAEQYASAAMRARKRSAKGYRKVRGRWKKLRVSFKESAVNDAPQLHDTGT